MGYRYPAKTIRFDGDPETPFAGLWVDLVQVRTGEELRALFSNQYQRELNEVMAKYIVAWNYMGMQLVTETVPADGALPEREASRLVEAELPAPCDHPEVMAVVDPDVLSWLHTKIVATYRWKPESDDPKAGTPSSDTPNGEPAEISTDLPSTANPKSRRPARGS